MSATADVLRSSRNGPETAAFDVWRVREDFPILKQKGYDRPLVFLDSAARAQKPRVVIEAIR